MFHLDAAQRSQICSPVLTPPPLLPSSSHLYRSSYWLHLTNAGPFLSQDQDGYFEFQ